MKHNKKLYLFRLIRYSFILLLASCTNPKQDLIYQQKVLAKEIEFTTAQYNEFEKKAQYYENALATATSPMHEGDSILKQDFLNNSIAYKESALNYKNEIARLKVQYDSLGAEIKK